MRVAFLITGFYRGFDDTKHKLFDWGDSVGADYFFTTWDKDERITNKDLYSRDITPDLFENINNKKQVNFLSVDSFKNNRVPWIRNPRDNDAMLTDPWAIQHNQGAQNSEYWANRIRDMWFLVNEAWKKFEPYSDNYDIVARIRFDVNITKWRMLNFVPDRLVVPVDVGGRVDLSDHFAYGSVPNMKKYCTFYEHMQKVYDDHNVNPMHPNNFLRYYLEKTEPPVLFATDSQLEYSIYIT